MNLQIITAPLIGGLIGLITNSLAIKMLFRPYKEIKIAGIHIPFTPGLIPKEKARIAHAIAQVIASYILDQDTILVALASDKIKEAYERKYDEYIHIWKSSEMTIGQVLSKYHMHESVNNMEKRISDSISNYLIEQCKEEELARKLIIFAFSSFKDNMNPLVYKMGKKALNTAQEAMIHQVDALIMEHGKEYIEQYLDQTYAKGLDYPIAEVILNMEQHHPNIKNLLWEKYIELIQNKFGKFLSTLNVQQIIENKINDYDLKELENMIMEISRKELNALVWLGGLLGVIMGFINLLF